MCITYQRCWYSAKQTISISPIPVPPKKWPLQDFFSSKIIDRAVNLGLKIKNSTSTHKTNRRGLVTLNDFLTCSRYHCVLSKVKMKYGDRYNVLGTRGLSNRDSVKVFCFEFLFQTDNLPLL